MTSSNPQVRGSASYMVWKMGGFADSYVPAITRLLINRDGDVRASAARALGDIGSGAVVAVPALIDRLQEKDGGAPRADTKTTQNEFLLPPSPQAPRIRANAAYALGKIGSASAVPALVTALQDKDAAVCASAIEALENIAADHARSVLKSSALTAPIRKGEIETTLTLWQNAQMSLDKMRSENMPDPVAFVQTKATVDLLVKTLQRAKLSR